MLKNYSILYKKIVSQIFLSAPRKSGNCHITVYINHLIWSLWPQHTRPHFIRTARADVICRSHGVRTCAAKRPSSPWLWSITEHSVPQGRGRGFFWFEPHTCREGHPLDLHKTNVKLWDTVFPRIHSVIS